MPIDIQVIDNAHTPGPKAGWAATGVMKSPITEWRAEMSFDEVLESRRSPSAIGEVKLDCTLGFVGHVFRTREVGHSENLGQARKPSISAGALHPTDVLVVAGPQVKEPILFSDRYGKYLTLPVKVPKPLRRPLRIAERFFQRLEGTSFCWRETCAAWHKSTDQRSHCCGATREPYCRLAQWPLSPMDSRFARWDIQAEPSWINSTHHMRTM